MERWLPAEVVNCHGARQKYLKVDLWFASQYFPAAKYLIRILLEAVHSISDTDFLSVSIVIEIFVERTGKRQESRVVTSVCGEDN